MTPTATDTAVKVSDALYEAAAELLRSRTGLVFSDTGKSRLADALAAELARRGHQDPAALLTRLRNDPAALEALAVATTIGETYFFRDEPQFRWLREALLPSLCAHSMRPGCRIF